MRPADLQKSSLDRKTANKDPVVNKQLPHEGEGFARNEDNNTLVDQTEERIILLKNTRYNF